MSSNSSGGQIAGYVIGAVVGYYMPGVGISLGSSIGGFLGGLADPPKGPNISSSGPRLSDLSGQSSNYGAPIPTIYGTSVVQGNLLWFENNRLKEIATTTTTRSGGKGGGGGSKQTYTTYSYTATFAVGLCKGPIQGVRRIWIGSRLVYDAQSDDYGTVIASNRLAAGMAIYTGSESQSPDPRIQANVGIANAPAYRGLAYIVFYDLLLTDYNNSLLGAQIKVEVIGVGANNAAARTIMYGNTSGCISGYTESSSIFGIQVNNVTKGTFYGYYGLGSYGSFVLNRRVLTPSGYSVVSSKTLADWTYISGSYGLKSPSGAIGVTNTYSGATHRFKIFNYNGDKIFEFNPYDSILNAWAGFDYGGCVLVGGRAYIRATDQGIAIFNNGRKYKDIPTSKCPDGRVIYQMFTDEYDNLYITNSNGIVRCHPDSLAPLEYFNTLYGLDTGYTWQFRRNGLFYATYSYGYGSYLVVRFQGSGGMLVNAPGSATASSNVPCIYLTNDLIYMGDRVINFADFDTSSQVALSGILSTECLKSDILSAGDIDVTSISQQVTGYRVTSVTPIRNNIEPLQKAFMFDAYQSGYKIKFKPRGASSVVSVPNADLGASLKEASPNLTINREMDSMLPARLSVTYMDKSREYDQGEQYADRLNTDAVNELRIEMPLVMTNDEAAKAAEILLYLYWMERQDVSLTLPPTYLHVEPCDIITVYVGSEVYNLRVVNVNYTSTNFIEVTAKLSESSVYSSSAIGAAGTPLTSVIPLNGPSMVDMIDLPLLDSNMNQLGAIIGSYGYESTWPGSSVFRSDDLQAWRSVKLFNGEPYPSGIVLTLLDPGRTDIIDKTNTLKVSIAFGSLSSVTEAQMLTGSNHFAIGAPGRWEIIAAQNCVLQGDGSYVLSDMLRGRVGTEWTMSLHTDSDSIVVLDFDKMAFVGLAKSDLNVNRYFKAVTFGDSLSGSESIFTFNYSGANLKCLTPVYLNGSINASGDWTLSWTRRTRLGGEWRDNVDATLSETYESYEVDIFSDNTYTAVKRVLTCSTSTVSYGSVQQVLDFGSNQGTLYVKIYQMSEIVGRGYPLQTAITR